LLASNFATVYPDGFVRIGGSKTLTFTSASAIEHYLPAGGRSRVLQQSYTNPTYSQGGLSAQLLALQLAADFSQAGVLQVGLGNMVMKSGPLAGQSVDQILAMANTVFGGTTSALPSGMSLTGLKDILESIIMNFHEGSPNGDLMECGDPGPTPPCSTVQLVFTGNSSTWGTHGNIRTFSNDGVSVKVSAFSRTKSSVGSWSAAYVGVWNEGLGVTDSSEGSGSGNSHKVDNNGRLNFLLFEFSQPVVISKAYLNSVGDDSDATFWVGTAVDPFNNHLTLSDSVVAGLSAAETSTGGGSARWAEFNDGEVSGNVLVIAAKYDDSNDAFKVSKLTARPECGTGPIDPVEEPTIEATGGTFVYSGDAYEGTCSVRDEDDSPLPGVLSYSPGSTAPVAVGSYTVSCEFAGNASYLPASASATLTITPKPVTITAGDGTKVYGTAADPALTAVATSGFVGSEADDVSLSQARTAGEDVGAYVTSAAASGAVLTNYTVTYVPGTFTISKAPLAVSTNDKTKVQGATNPALDGTLTGVVAGDVITATYSTTATAASPVGAYPITPSLTDPNNRLVNYAVTIVNGTLTVTAGGPAPCSTAGYTTYSQGGWGAPPSGSNPGSLLMNNFSTVYPSGWMLIGGHKSLKFTSASAIATFLPAGGTSQVLTSNRTNPTSSEAGVFAGQVLALQLAVDFSAAGVTKSGLGTLIMQSGPFAGQTVNEILGVANAVLGGDTDALPTVGPVPELSPWEAYWYAWFGITPSAPRMTVEELSEIVESLVMNFHEGTANEGLVGCGETPGPTPCSVSQFAFTGSSSTSGSAGNIRTFSADGVSVKAAAFSRTKSSGYWSTAFLGVFGSAGLGVTDGSEGSGGNDSHKVDNLGDRHNYVVFTFSQPLVVTRAFLDSIGSDSDATVWVGTVANAHTSLPAVNDAFLSSLASESSSGGSSSRWASFNGDGVSGNVLVIAANTSGSNDAFKIAKIDVACASGN
jgi:hypothetical protein